jgi:polyhydroxybutyrate depolymerase
VTTVPITPSQRGPDPEPGRARRVAASLVAGPLLAAGLLVGLAGPGVGPIGATDLAGAATKPASVPAAPSAGCRATTAAAPGETTFPLTVGSRHGFYIQQLPTTYDGRTPMPVVFDFHGYSEPASGQVTLSALGTYGQSHGFITITPGVTEPVPLWEATIGSADMKFVGGLFDTVEKTLCVDQNRLYSTGYSNGAFLSSAIACQYAGRIAAVAPVAGIQNIAGCHPSRPVPVVAFHGTADPFVHFNGTPSQAAANLPAPTGKKGTLGHSGDKSALKKAPSIPDDTAAWAKRNGCASGSTSTKVASDVTLVRYRCPNNADVELYVVKGGGHAWPGSKVSEAIHSVVGRTTFSITADAIMWRFFAAHPLTRRS